MRLDIKDNDAVLLVMRAENRPFDLQTRLDVMSPHHFVFLRSSYFQKIGLDRELTMAFVVNGMVHFVFFRWNGQRNNNLKLAEPIYLVMDLVPAPLDRDAWMMLQSMMLVFSPPPSA